MGSCGCQFYVCVKVPILSIESPKLVQMDTVNVQDFNDASLSPLASPVIFKGFGSSLAAQQAAFQGFALNLVNGAKTRTDSQVV